MSHSLTSRHSDDRRLVDDLMANPDVMPDLTRSDMVLPVATHEMGFAREVADRLVFMDSSEIVEVATPAAFFENSERPIAFGTN